MIIPGRRIISTTIYIKIDFYIKFYKIISNFVYKGI